MDAFAPDVGRYPGTKDNPSCVFLEGDLGPGDMIFIPERWPHAVDNIEDGTMAVSYNFVDE